MKLPAITLPPRDRRALVLGVATIAGAWLVTRAVSSGVRAVADLRLRTAARVEELAKAREAVAAEPWARESLGVRAQRLVAWAPRLVAGVSAADARAELAAFATSVAALRRVRIARQDQLPDSAAGLFTEVALRLQAEGDIGGMAAWLADLEEGSKLIAIPELTLTALEPATPAAQPERLTAGLVVTAWAPHTRSR